MDKKYYWILVWYDSTSREVSTDHHPFLYISRLRKQNKVPILLNWKKITKEEFELYAELNKESPNYNVEVFPIDG